MKIAYVAICAVADNFGVPKKIQYQLNGWRGCGAECEFFGAAPDANSPERIVEGQIFERKRGGNLWQQWQIDRAVLGKMLDAVRDWKPDLVYLRWGYHKKECLKLAKEFPTVIEVNGDIIETAYLKVSSERLLKRYFGLYIRATVPLLFREACGFVAVTHEVGRLDYLTKWRKPIGVFPNSIALQEYEALPFEDEEGKLPRLVFIGNVQAWHGLDQLVKLARSTVGELEFDVVGCEETPELRTENITFHGYLKREDYLKVFRKASVGIDGLAIYRKKMDEACALKIREYAASGLPLILASEDTAFMGIEADWILRIGNDEGNVTDNREKIVKFAKDWRGRRNTHAEVATYVDSAEVEKRRLLFLQQVYNKNHKVKNY